MSNEMVSIDQFLEVAHNHLIVDVRAPKEFMRGHLPGSVNIPVFSDEQRALVGTEYNRKGQQAAIMLGLKLIGPELVDRCKQLVNQSAAGSTILLYCWRGGMRSASMEWLFNMIGYPTQRLTGGYKSYRRFVQQSLSRKFNLRIVAGATGAGKTEVLTQLAEMGEQVLDLEHLANHRGSAFGGLGLPPQPGTQTSRIKHTLQLIP